MNSCSGRRPRTMASSLALAQDTITDILSRLPVKTLTRFKSVSKKWADLTSTPAFVSAHLRRSRPDPHLIVRRYHTQTGYQNEFWLYSDPTRHTRSYLLDIPSEEPILRFPKIVGSVDGLVCLDVSPSCASDFILWNPGTKKFRSAPFPLIASSKDNPIWLLSVGFGFDSFNNDYKIVRIVSCKSDDPSPSLRVEVFSWKQWAWKEKEETFDLSVSCSAAEGVVAGGTLNWLAIGLMEHANQKFVISFDLEAEALKRIALPRITRDGNVKVMSYMGSLAIAVYPILYTLHPMAITRFEFWVHGQDWTKMRVIEGFSKVLVPVRTWKDHDLVFKNMGAKDIEVYQNFVLFDPFNERTTNLAPEGIDMCLEPWSYVDSLVSVDGRN